MNREELLQQLKQIDERGAELRKLASDPLDFSNIRAVIAEARDNLFQRELITDQLSRLSTH